MEKLKMILRVKRPHADFLEEAIERGYAMLRDPGAARSLGRTAKQTGAFIVSRPNKEDYGLITPINLDSVVKRYETYTEFLLKDNTKKRR